MLDEHDEMIEGEEENESETGEEDELDGFSVKDDPVDETSEL